MKRSVKHLSSEANFCHFLQLNWSNFSVKGLRVTKIVKEIQFEGVWGELESKKGVQRKSVKNIETNSSFRVK